ncbi:MAG: hypothetical protein QGI09_11605, partial [Dehalococcoidia bacterium]|nr:hypothetical protein [Dehalococcoidia bacterium]
SCWDHKPNTPGLGASLNTCYTAFYNARDNPKGARPSYDPPALAAETYYPELAWWASGLA